MVFQIVWSPRALADLREIVAYIHERNHLAAGPFGQKLIDKVETLQRFPERGRMIRKFQDPDIREVFLGSYRIAYRIMHQPSQVEVARIWHGAQSEENFEL
jgi:addiction module RelE/StbE family toxin